MGALDHLRVLDLTRVLAGPWCTQNLADLGAEVIKIERPGVGDECRHWGPPFLESREHDDTKESSFYLAANRNKKSLTLDLATIEGQDIVKQLILKTDILVENFKVGQLKNYHLDYESLKMLRPDLIYCSITGFGQDGPLSDQPGYDLIIEGMAGFMSVTGDPNGKPMKAGVPISDLLTGMYATSAILAAVIHRQKTGEGQYLDIALMDTQVASMANVAQSYLMTGIAPGLQGNQSSSVVPYQTFQTKDGFITVVAGNDMQFKALMQVCKRTDLAEDARFTSNALRIKYKHELIHQLELVFVQHPTQMWLRALSDAGVPCGSIHSMKEVFDHPQVQARQLKQSLRRADGVSVDVVRNPMRLSQSDTQIKSPPPLLGQHTATILNELGIDTAAQQKLRNKGII